MLDNETAREMLILAGLTYRGSLDPDILPGERHDGVLAQGVRSGLDTLAPVQGKWELVWGPASSRAGGQFDSSAMYVVRHRNDRQRYVVAMRGTNPVSLPDWLLGDLNVATSVAWPFDPDGAEVSTSTAFGLYSLLQLRVCAAWGDPRRSGPCGGQDIDGVPRDHPRTRPVAADTLRTVRGISDSVPRRPRGGRASSAKGRRTPRLVAFGSARSNSCRGCRRPRRRRTA